MRTLLKFIHQAIFGLRLRLLLLIALACAPLVGWTLNTAWDERRRQVANLQQRSRTLAEQAATQEQKVLEDTRQMLLVLSKTAQPRIATRQRFKRLVDELFPNHSQYADLGVISTNGDVIANISVSAAPPS